MISKLININSFNDDSIRDTLSGGKTRAIVLDDLTYVFGIKLLGLVLSKWDYY